MVNETHKCRYRNWPSVCNFFGFKVSCLKGHKRVVMVVMTVESKPLSLSAIQTEMAQTTQLSPPAVPTKRIISRAHLQTFLDSPTHADVVNFITELNESVVGVKLSDQVHESKVSATRCDTIWCLIREIDTAVI